MSHFNMEVLMKTANNDFIGLAAPDTCSSVGVESPSSYVFFKVAVTLSVHLSISIHPLVESFSPS